MPRVPLLFRHGPDVLELLRAHADVVGEGVAAFALWSATTDAAEASAVRGARYRAEQAHRALVQALREALSTPVDREDLYVLSERLQDVIVVAKTTVREADAVGFRADEHSAAMGRLVHEGTEALVAAVVAYHVDADGALAAVDNAGSACGDLDHAYRTAISVSWDGVDVRTTVSRQSVYRRYAELSEAIARVTHRVWFGVLKDA